MGKRETRNGKWSGSGKRETAGKREEQTGGKSPDLLATAERYVRERLGVISPRIAIVLGSGLSGLAERFRPATRIPYADIPGFPRARTPGHEGQLVLGELSGVPLAILNGRFHLYEGHSPEAVVLPVRLLASLGVDTLIVTGAAGGLRASLRPPSLMLIADHVNLMWRNPLIGPVLESEERFPDMSEPYDRELRALALRTARELGITLEEGVYAGVLGPSYETPAEIEMLRRLGADAVAMSVVPEVIAARARGMRVLGIAVITNLAAGLSGARLSHDEVLEAGRVMAADLERLIQGLLAQPFS
ncbi:MAG: purine-nucleoside phosphorylase [Gemmatimonadales bacterium]